MFNRQWEKGHFLCAGLDTDSLNANRRIVDNTYDLVCAYKLNLAFYLHDMYVLRATCQHIRQTDIPIILDAKWGDVHHTNEACAQALDFDAVTVNPYVGLEDLEPLMNKFAFVLCHTSNPGAAQFQRLNTTEGPLYEVVAREVTKYPDCGLVVGATYPDVLRRVRAIVGNMPILIPGIGAQGGSVQDALAGLDHKGRGIILSASRSIADNPRRAVTRINRQVLEFIS